MYNSGDLIYHLYKGNVKQFSKELANIRVINKARANSQVTNFFHHIKPVFCELREIATGRQPFAPVGRSRESKASQITNPSLLRDKNIFLSARFIT